MMRGLRSVRAGVTRETLTKDLALWRGLGAAIVDLAHLVRAHCAGKRLLRCGGRRSNISPRVWWRRSTTQIDMVAWGVIAAQARLMAARAGE